MIFRLAVQNIDFLPIPDSTLPTYNALSDDTGIILRILKGKAMFGKLFGGIWGFWAGGPVGARFGQAWGQQWDEMSKLWLPQWQVSIQQGHVGPIEENFTQPLFRILGHLARQGNQLESIKASIDHLADQLQLSSKSKIVAINAFIEGTDDSGLDSKSIQQISQQIFWAPQNVGIALSLAIQVCLVGGEPNPSQKSTLQELCRQLGIPHSTFELIYEKIRQQYCAHNPNADISEDEAYQTLAINKPCSAEEIKKAYRRKMNQYHPDKLTAHGKSEAEIAEALVKAQQIQDAYQYLKNRV